MITKIIAEISCTLEEIQWEMTLMLGAFELCGIPENTIKATEGTLIVPIMLKKLYLIDFILLIKSSNLYLYL